MAKLNFKYGILDDNNKITYAPYKLHYGNKYVINGSETKYRACGYYPVVLNDYPTDTLKENEYFDCQYKYIEEETQKYINGFFIKISLDNQ